MAWCSPSLWGQRAAETAGYSSPPAVPSPPELWSALPPEQTHKLPANTKQSLINYQLRPPPQHDDHQTVTKHSLPRSSLQRGSPPSSHFPLSARPAAVLDSPYQQYFGHLSPTTSYFHPPVPGSANTALKSAEKEIKWHLITVLNQSSLIIWRKLTEHLALLQKFPKLLQEVIVFRQQIVMLLSSPLGSTLKYLVSIGYSTCLLKFSASFWATIFSLFNCSSVCLKSEVEEKEFTCQNKN